MSPSKPKTSQVRTKRHVRSKTPAPFKLMERDVQILKHLVSYRLLTIEQVGWLFPDGSQQNLGNRLRHLYQHGYAERIHLPLSGSRDPLIYALTEKGAQLLAEQQGIDRSEIRWKRHYNQLQPYSKKHLLLINQVMISYRQALGKEVVAGRLSDFRVVRGESKRLKLTVVLRDRDGRRSEHSVVPDALIYLVLPNKEAGLFFVEVDRATMTTGRWQGKIEVYREYGQSAQLQERFHTNWFILLTVTTTDRRIASLAEKTVELGGRRGYWFTTAEQVTPDTALAALWVRASDLFQQRNEQMSKLADPAHAKRLALLDALGYDNG